MGGAATYQAGFPCNRFCCESLLKSMLTFVQSGHYPSKAYSKSNPLIIQRRMTHNISTKKFQKTLIFIVKGASAAIQRFLMIFTVLSLYVHMFICDFWWKSDSLLEILYFTVSSWTIYWGKALKVKRSLSMGIDWLQIWNNQCFIFSSFISTQTPRLITGIHINIQVRPEQQGISIKCCCR